MHITNESVRATFREGKVFFKNCLFIHHRKFHSLHCFQPDPSDKTMYLLENEANDVLAYIPAPEYVNGAPHNH